MSFAAVLFILFVFFMVLSVLFAGLPRVESITWTPRREALMYKTAYWMVILAAISVVLALICFAKGY